VLKEVRVALIMFHPSREFETEWEMSSKDERKKMGRGEAEACFG